MARTTYLHLYANTDDALAAWSTLRDKLRHRAGVKFHRPEMVIRSPNITYRFASINTPKRFEGLRPEQIHIDAKVPRSKIGRVRHMATRQAQLVLA